MAFLYCNLSPELAERQDGAPVDGVDRAYDPQTADVSLAGKYESEARHLCCRNVTQVDDRFGAVQRCL